MIQPPNDNPSPFEVFDAAYTAAGLPAKHIDRRRAACFNRAEHGPLITRCLRAGKVRKARIVAARYIAFFTKACDDHDREAGAFWK